MKNLKMIMILFFMSSFAMPLIAQSSEDPNQTEKKYNYFTIKVNVINGETKIDMDQNFLIAPDEAHLFAKIEKLNELNFQIENGGVDLVSELGLNGYKIVSHSFSILKEDHEVHYYILEL